MPPDQSEDPREWLRYAREDLDAARASLDQQWMAPRHICYLAQQSAEKALKAALWFVGVTPPRIHHLDALRNMLPSTWKVRIDEPDLAELTVWGMEARYPQEFPAISRDSARLAIETAEEVWASVLKDLTLDQ